MDMLDQTLETSQDKDGESPRDESGLDHKDILTGPNLTIVEADDGSMGSPGEITGDTGEDQAAVAGLAHQGLLDPSGAVQYQFRAENGQGGTVTYRVVQVGQGSDGVEAIPQIVASPPPFATAAQQGVQAVLTSPLNGQFYVIGSPQDVLGNSGQRSIAPRIGQIMDSSRGSSSDERRRATHNEVERRRRDKINNWIIKLSKIIPDCSQEHTKQGQVSSQSKGGILAKACEYITELRTANVRLGESIKESDRLSLEVEVLRQENNSLKREITLLRTQLAQHGAILPDINPVVSS